MKVTRPAATRRLLLFFTLAILPGARMGGAQTAPQAPPKKPWYDTVTFKGFIQLDAIFPEGNAAIGPISNFRIRRARPTFVIQVDPLTRVQVQFDLSTGKCGTGPSTASVADTYAERKLPGFGYVQLGQNLLPFSHEVKEDNAAIRSPLELSYTAEQVALLERDIGIFVRSLTEETDIFHWEVGIVNGQGWRTADSNPNKTLVGRVTYKFHPYLRVGASTIYGTWRGANGQDFDRHVQGYEFESNFNKALKLGGEFYHCKFVDSTSAATPKVARFDGGYLLLETWIGSLKSIPFIRYQRTYGDLDYRSFDLGWRYQYTPTQRVTLEYDIVKGHQRDMFGLRWQLGF
jgi:hypothetical protein